MLKINILIDNPKSWYMPYGKQLANKLRRLGNKVVLVKEEKKIQKGDIAFFLSCEKIISRSIRSRNVHNLVIHASDLPKGRGWSPMAWQILQGRNLITASLFEAADKVDSGLIYFQERIALKGNELIAEWREKEAQAIERLALAFVKAYPSVLGRPQKGKTTLFRRRIPADSKMDPKKTIAEQFDLLRIVDNERYPAFFKFRGYTYLLKIEKQK